MVDSASQRHSRWAGFHDLADTLFDTVLAGAGCEGDCQKNHQAIAAPTAANQQREAERLCRVMRHLDDESGENISERWRPLGDSNPCYRRERAVS